MENDRAAQLAQLELELEAAENAEAAAAVVGFPVDNPPEELPELHGGITHLAQILTADPELYIRLRLQTTRSGTKFATVIKPGMDIDAHFDENNPPNPPLPVVCGIVAGDEHCYTFFKDVFDPVIELEHEFTIKQKHQVRESNRVASVRGFITHPISRSSAPSCIVNSYGATRCLAEFF
jgi:hypothetical protein